MYINIYIYIYMNIYIYIYMRPAGRPAGRSVGRAGGRVGGRAAESSLNNDWQGAGGEWSMPKKGSTACPRRDQKLI